MPNDEWFKIAPASELAEGGMLGIEVGDLQVAIIMLRGSFTQPDNVRHTRLCPPY
jgi:hypothetical protein